MNQGIKKYFFDETTAQPRWGVITIVALLFLVILMYVIKAAKQGYKPEASSGAGAQNGGNGSPLSQPPTAKDVTPAPVDDNLGDMAAQLHRVNAKTYWFCSGNEEPNERCFWYKKVLELSDASTKTVANIYQQKYSKKLIEDLAMICDCVSWSGTMAGDIKKKLEGLGLK